MSPVAIAPRRRRSGGGLHVVTTPCRSRCARNGTSQKPAIPAPPAQPSAIRRSPGRGSRRIAASTVSVSPRTTPRISNEIRWVMASAASEAASSTTHRRRPSAVLRTAAPSARQKNTDPTWCGTRPVSNIPRSPSPNGVDTRVESTAARPDARRPSPNERPRKDTAGGSATSEATQMAFSAATFDTAPNVTPLIAAISHVRPGPLKRNSWWPTTNRGNQPSSRPWATIWPMP